MEKHLINLLIMFLVLFIPPMAWAEEQKKDNSAVLARIRQLRKMTDSMDPLVTFAEGKESLRPTRQTNDGISFKGQKAKRYRCYLVDDDEENLAKFDGQQNGGAQIIREHEGKSFFVGFQRDREEKNGNNILGWEERNSEGARRSEGTRSRYLFSERRRTTEGPASEKPIIEYLDYEAERTGGNGQPNKIENATPMSPAQFSRTTKATPKLNSKFLNILQQAKISRRPLPSMEKERKLSSESNGESAGDEEPESSREMDENNYNDLYITTTTITSTAPSTRKPALRRPPINAMPRAQGTPTPYNFEEQQQRARSNELPRQLLSAANAAQSQQSRGQNASPPKAMPHEVVVESGATTSSEEEQQEEKEEVHAMRPATPQHFHNFAAQLLQPNAQSTPPRLNAAQNLWPNQPQFQTTQQYNQQQLLFPQQQQQAKSTAQRNRNPQRDSQGRPLVLSPEHCKMMDNYAQIYGLRLPTNVMNFVHNNCAFAKIYLPAASCAEIDILVQSCYQRRN